MGASIGLCCFFFAAIAPISDELSRFMSKKIFKSKAKHVFHELIAEAELCRLSYYRVYEFRNGNTVCDRAAVSCVIDQNTGQEHGTQVISV